MGEGSDALTRDEDDTTAYGPNSTAGRDVDDAAATPETVEIRANIEQTRAEMSETIEAIQERLSPQHLKEQVKGQVREQFEEVKSTVRDATIGKAETMVRSASESVTEARYTLMETIRQNPIPAAMVGIGLGWLLMNRRSAPSYNTPRYEQRGYRGVGYYDAGGYGAEQTYRGYGRPEAYYEEPHEGIASQGRRAVRNTVGRVQDTAGDVAGRVQETVGDVAGRAQETASTVAGQVQEAASTVAERAQETASTLAARTQYQAYRLEDRFQSALYENPLALGAIALAVGAAVGLAAPGTERENELLGEARDNLVERAQEVAHETVEKLQQVAGQVVEEVQTTTQKAAQDQGLTS